MDDRTAASAGFTLAGVALAAVVWGLRRGGQPVAFVAAALAAVTLAGFALRRYGRLDRTKAAPLAGVTAAGTAIASSSAAFLGGGAGTIVAAIVAALAAIAAYADWLSLNAEALVTRTGRVASAAAIGAMGILAIYAWLLPLGLLAGAIVPGGIGRASQILLSTVASGAGTVTVVVLYLRWGERDVSFLDVRWPDLRGLGYAIGGTLVILGGNVAIGLAFQRAGIEAASHSIVRMAASDPAVLLALIPLSYLVIGPGEELLYRNVVQKSLRETFSPVGGVVVASVVFAVVHLPAYMDPDGGLAATVSTLGVVFVLALVLGTLYERTGNVVVPALAHGTFNAVAFAATYARLTGLFGG